jgi:hypothetical protein
MSYVSVLYIVCVYVPDDTCLCTFFMELCVSFFCVACLVYDCLLSWIEFVFLHCVCRYLVFKFANVSDIEL